MKAKQLVAVVLVVAGTLGLIFRGFNYRRESHQAAFGPFKVAITHNDRVPVPVWASVLAIAAGVVILVVKRED